VIACFGALLLAPFAGAAAPPTARAAPGAKPAATAPQAPDAVAAARALEARLNGVRGLSARFTQRLESAALPSAQVEAGTVYLQRPGRMRWEYEEPRGKLAVADGVRSWLFLPEDRQVLVTPLPDVRHDQGIGLLLRERLDLLAEFSPAWGPPFEPDGSPALLLRPRSAQASFDRLAVEVDPTSFPVRIAVFDPLGGSVTYGFSGLRFVDRLDESLFRFTPPPGMSVQELAP